MALQKQSVNINFAQGIDTKSDPYQIAPGKFLSLTNSVFGTTGRLTKRNGFKKITTVSNASVLTTLNDNLVTTGDSLQIYSQETDQWFDKGSIRPVQLATAPLVRVSTAQTAQDSVVAANGLLCLVYMDNGNAYYEVHDSSTSQQIVTRTLIQPDASNPRVFLFPRHFIITYIALIAGIPHLRYLAVPLSTPDVAGTPTDISAVVNTVNAGYDCYVANNTLFVAWGATASTFRYAYLTPTFTLSAPVIQTGYRMSKASVTADTTQGSPIIWISFYEDSTTTIYTMAISLTLGTVLDVTPLSTAVQVNTMTSVAQNSACSIFLDVLNYYNSAGAYPTSNIQTDYIQRIKVLQDGTVDSTVDIIKSVGLGSKAFLASGKAYMLVVYGQPSAPSLSNQSTYFLIDSDGNVFMRLNYSNSGGYASTQVLPSITNIDGVYYVAYLANDFLASVNKNTNLSAGTPVNSIYTQTGINLAMMQIGSADQYSAEIAGSLHLTGGQLWQYDGVKPVEHGFHVWPENIAYTSSNSGGSITAQIYYYVFTYEWTDNQGNLHRSAPSIPLKADLTAGSNSKTVTLYVPTLRLTYKTDPNPVRIVGYRWSAGQQTYYQFTSLTSPTLNDKNVDYVTITDTLADSSILGNTLLYTTGGVVENIAAPASVASTLFKNRLFIVDAEDRNLIWYSKPIIQNTPVEMSDLFTQYVAPTSGAQGSTGPITALSAMDDKLIIFKKDAIYYMTGTGPDITGLNNDFSDPIFITSSVGTANPRSIVLMPNGLMFQSDKGIWLLSRDLNTVYIGADVEKYNTTTVRSAAVIPGTNQVRFVVDNSTTLMYDYFYQQWGVFTNLRAVSATLYQGAHTYLNSLGQVFQETPGTYLDGSTPVLMSFTTSWMNVAGLQGYERFYFCYLLGTYLSPFKLNVQLAYDYNSSSTQAITVTQDNYSPNWGGESLWGGGSTWGGNSQVFEARIFPQVQKCESFQVTINEIYDPSYGVTAGAGLTLSGLNLVVGTKKGYRIQRASRSFG